MFPAGEGAVAVPQKGRDKTVLLFCCIGLLTWHAALASRLEAIIIVGVEDGREPLLYGCCLLAFGSWLEARKLKVDRGEGGKEKSGK